VLEFVKEIIKGLQDLMDS